MSPLPIWAQSNEAQRLLARIKKNSASVVRYDDGLSMFNGRKYVGKDVEQLRAIFDNLFTYLIAWVNEARVNGLQPGRPQPKLLGERHDAVARYMREFGPDAVIASILGDAE